MRLLIEGADAEALDGFEIRDRPGLRSGPAHVTPISQTGERAVVVGDPRTGARRLVVQGQIRADSVQDMQDRIDRLKARMRQREEVEVSFSDLADRVWFGRYRTIDPRPFPRERPRTLMRVSLVWDLVRPFAYSAEQTIDGIGAGGSVIPLGSERTFDLLLRISGPAAAPIVVRIRNAAGDPVQTLTLDAALADAADWLEVDTAKASITDRDGRDRGNVRTVGSHWPLILDPRDNAGVTDPPTGPTLSVSSGTGRAKYRQAW